MNIHDIFGNKVVPRSAFAIIKDVKPNGKHGGTSRANTTHKRDLNTIEYNEITGLSLASNHISLPAGEYNVIAYSSQHNSRYCVLFIKDETNNKIICRGLNQAPRNAASGENMGERTSIAGKITAATPIEISLNIYINTAAAQGLGLAVNDPENENYSVVFLQSATEVVR